MHINKSNIIKYKIVFNYFYDYFEISEYSNNYITLVVFYKQTNLINEILSSAKEILQLKVDNEIIAKTLYNKYNSGIDIDKEIDTNLIILKYDSNEYVIDRDEIPF